MVKEGKETEHDRLLKEFVLRIGNNSYLDSVWFPPLQDADSRKRILALRFRSVADWRSFRASSIDDLRWFVDKWLPCVELDSYRIFFWRGDESYED
jgi:hypothetical protein